MALRLKAPLIAYRIADSRHPILDGRGAQLFGGRWTSPGQRVVYASLSMAGAMLEVLAYAGIGRFPRHQVWTRITVPKGLSFEEVTAAGVPGWDRADLVASRACGDAWVKSRRTAVLIVPSVVARADRNVLINLEHPGTRKIRHSPPQPVLWDQRLKKLFQ